MNVGRRDVDQSVFLDISTLGTSHGSYHRSRHPLFHYTCILRYLFVYLLTLSPPIAPYAHLPNTLIPINPTTNAPTAGNTLPAGACLSGPSTKSCASSLNAVYSKIPAETAFKIPTERRDAFPFCENTWRTAIPIAIPMGVMRMKATDMVIARTLEIQYKRAIRAPRAAPSKNWWKQMTMRRVVQPAPEEAPRVTPIMILDVSCGTDGERRDIRVENDSHFEQENAPALFCCEGGIDVCAVMPVRVRVRASGDEAGAGLLAVG